LYAKFFKDSNVNKYVTNLINEKGDALRNDPDYIASLPVTDARVLADDIKLFYPELYAGINVSQILDRSTRGFGTALVSFTKGVHSLASANSYVKEYRYNLSSDHLEIKPESDFSYSFRNGGHPLVIEALRHTGLKDAKDRENFGLDLKNLRTKMGKGIIVVPLYQEKGRKWMSSYTECIRHELKNPWFQNTFCVRRVHGKTVFFYFLIEPAENAERIRKVFRATEIIVHAEHLEQFNVSRSPSQLTKLAQGKRRRSWKPNSYLINPKGKKEKKKGKGPNGSNHNNGGGGGGGNMNGSWFETIFGRSGGGHRGRGGKRGRGRGGYRGRGGRGRQVGQ
jgi:hypothetical protein